jgi:hypothetical protein
MGIHRSPRIHLPFEGADALLTKSWPGRSRALEAVVLKEGDHIGGCKVVLNTLLERFTHRPNADLFFVRREGEPAVQECILVSIFFQ